VGQLFIQTCINQTSWLVNIYNILGARMSHGQMWTHKIHYGPDLGEATTFPLIVFFVFSYGVGTQMSFCHVVILKIGTTVTLEAHNFF
jgi:hypothetical protein